MTSKTKKMTSLKINFQAPYLLMLMKFITSDGKELCSIWSWDHLLNSWNLQGAKARLIATPPNQNIWAQLLMTGEKLATIIQAASSSCQQAGRGSSLYYNKLPYPPTIFASFLLSLTVEPKYLDSRALLLIEHLRLAGSIHYIEFSRCNILKKILSEVPKGFRHKCA